VKSSSSYVAKLLLLNISYLSIGITLPAMSLIIVSKGFPLPYLGVAIACMSISVIIFEVPSGIFCDAKGRRTSFLIGMILTLLGTIPLFTSSFILICLGFSFNGIGRAFGSGSLDSLLIEDAQQLTGDVSNAVFAIELSSSLSLAIGALFGGFLLNMGSPGGHLTDYLLIGRIILIVLNIGLTPILVSNDRVQNNSHTLKEQLSALFQGVRGNRDITSYLVTAITLGVFLSAAETYWQPYLKTLLHDDSKLWILGIVASSMFALSMVGSLLGKILLHYFCPSTLSRLLFLGDFLLMALLSRSTTLWMFLILFMLLYLILGALSIARSTYLNKKVKNSVRASMLSLSSFALQIGGVLSSLVSAFLLSFVDISRFWMIVALSGAITVLVVFNRPKEGDCIR
jgi:MFS family permease